MSNKKADILVASFPSDKEAQDALKHVERVLASTDRKLQQGALINRSSDGELSVRDLKDTSLRDIVASGTNLAIFLGAGTVRIALNATKAGAALLWHSGNRFLDLTGAFVTYPLKKLGAFVRSDDEARALGQALAPGSTAVALVVDAESAVAIRDAITAAGGTLIEKPDNTQQP